MMMRTLLIVAILFPGCCMAQLRASLSTGLAGFNMQDMKKHQSELKAQFPADAKVIESFPAYWFYEASLTGKLTKRVNIGGALGFTSTGGHMDYHDYSGGIVCDQTTKAWTVAAKTEVLLTPNSRWKLYLTGKAGAYIGRYDLKLLVDVNNDRDDTNYGFTSANFFVEPGLMLSKRIIGRLNANANAGYNFNVYKGQQKFSDNTKQYLQNNSGEEVHLDWSGFRVGVGLSVEF